MLLSTLFKRINHPVVLSQDLEVNGLSLEASKVQPGDLFVALKGAKADGAHFIPEAVQNGAVAILSETPTAAEVPVIVDEKAREMASHLASLLYPSDNLTKVAVTGTNGKTSTVFFVRQIMNALGTVSASLGTIGMESPVYTHSGRMTTPDAVTLNRDLHQFASAGGQLVALEASSHGLEQGRLQGHLFQAAAFTNITRDHLDYHKTMEAYLEAKLKLFTTYLCPEGVAVLNADIPEYDYIRHVCQQTGHRILSYGEKGQDLTLVSLAATEMGQTLEIEAWGKHYQVTVNIAGAFQAMNILAAVGLCVGVGAPIEKVMAILPQLTAPAGRMELVASLKNGAQIFVDYAHTPDALERVLLSLRAHTKGRLVCLFGCGGNRDKGKRPQMGAIAERLADRVYITDDNPRFEEADIIRNEIKVACPRGIEVANRAQAILEAVQSLQKDDVLLLAGKGHETGQQIHGISYAFSDREEARLAVMKREQTMLWSAQELSLALSVPVSPLITVFDVSIDTRTLKAGDMYIALKGDKADGHHYVAQAVEKGAAVCLVSQMVEGVPPQKQIIVADTQKALENLARFARMRSEAIFIGITGSSGKTTTKEMLKTVLADQGPTFATSGNLNNQIGVPLTMTRIPLNTRYAIVEMGMNHAGEMLELSDIVRPDITVIVSLASAHRAFFKTEEDIAAAKAEIFEYQTREGTAVLNRDNAFYDFFVKALKQQGIMHTTSFGTHEKADFCLLSTETDGLDTRVKMRWHQKEYHFLLHFLGQHFAMNALAVLGVVEAVGADVEKAMASLSKAHPAIGRGAQFVVTLPSGKNVVLIDDAYNANPASMAASIETLGLMTAGRRIAVLGDMRELGAEGPALHMALKDVLIRHHIQRVYTVGPLMNELFQTLPDDMRARAVEEPRDLIEVLQKDLQENDAVLVKASNGTGLKVVVEALKGSK